jgi:hypothetical protein
MKHSVIGMDIAKKTFHGKWEVRRSSPTKHIENGVSQDLSHFLPKAEGAPSCK